MKLSEVKYEKMELDEISKKLDSLLELFSSAANANEQVKLYNEMYGYLDKVSTQANLVNIRFTLNMSDSFYKSEQEFWDSATPVIKEKIVAFGNAVLDSKFRKELEAALPAKIFRDLEIARKSMSPKIVELGQEENKIVTEYSILMSSLTVEFRGEKMPTSKLRGYFINADRETRREAYEVMGKVLEDNSQKLDDIFDRLVAVRTKQAAVMGYKNFVELGYYRMGRNCYDEKMVSVFRENVLNDIVPVVNGLLERTAKQIGIGKRFLYDNDIFSKEGSPKPAGTVEEIFAKAEKMYNDMSPAAAKLYKLMSEFESFDVLPRENKWGGGYCTELADYKMPFVLANFNGSSDDIDVLTHEFGHALASYEAANGIKYQALRIGGMETCEIHSMSMEFLAEKYMELFFKEKAKDYNFSHLASSIAFIPYGVIVDEFQHIVYSNPNLTPKERNDEWLKLEQKYRPLVDTKGMTYYEKGTRWQHQMHIYEMPFYYIDYCLAQCAALQFAVLMEKDYNAAFETYMSLLKKAGTKTYTELLVEAGLASPFEKGELKKLAAEIDKKLKRFENK